MKRSLWKSTKKMSEDFLRAFPELRSDEKTRSTLNMMSLWQYATDLRNEKRYEELVWIQPNLIELLVNGLLSTYFAVRKDIRYQKADNFILSLNFFQRNNLLFLLGLVSEETFGMLEKFRTLRNDLMHKLMQKIKFGGSLDVLCRDLCEIGFDLQEELHETLWTFVRQNLGPDSK